MKKPTPSRIRKLTGPGGLHLRPFAVGLALALGLAAPAQAQVEFAFYQRPGSVYEMHVPENSLHAEILVSVRGSPNDTGVEASVDYSTADATAVSGEDFTAVSGTLHFAAGERFQWISVPILNDGRSEPEEHFVVVLKNPTGGASLGDPAEVGVYITDYDPGLSFTSRTYSASENEGTVTLTVLRGNEGDLPFTVDYGVTGGTATPGVDFEAISGTLEFAVDEASKALTVRILNDGEAEPDETITLALSNPSHGMSLGINSTATVSLRDNDPGVSFTRSACSASESQGTVTLTVLRGNDGDLPFTVDYGVTGGTATPGVDFEAISGTLEFAAGEASKALTVRILNDGEAEPDETITLALSNPSHGVPLGINSTATVSLRDNDPGVAFAKSDYTASEAQAEVTLTVFRGNDGDFPCTVDYAVTGGTAMAGEDFEVMSGTLEFAAGETSKSIVMTLLNDGIPEPEETITLALSNPSHSVSLGINSAATVSLRDNDPGVSFTSRTYSASENQGTVTLTVLRGNDGDFPCTVDYAVTGGTATPGEDFEVVSGTLEFAGGETSKSIVITLLDDGIEEPEETIVLTLSNPTGGAFLGSPVTTTVHFGPTYYVNAANPNPVEPYVTWETAATNIQAAINAGTGPGREVVVTNGVYVEGVKVPDQVTLRSVNGPKVTVIDGDWSRRCAELADSAVISGFTLRYGVADSGGGAYGGTLTNCTLTGNRATQGGGAWRCTLYNCTVSRNAASQWGGGVSECTLYNCLLSGNTQNSDKNESYYGGGGADWSTLYNCVLTGNSAWTGGAAIWECKLYNCTLTGNRATQGGGGVDATCKLYNCIVYGNEAPEGANYLPATADSSSTSEYSCTTPLPEGPGNIDADPRLIAGNHLSLLSPCVGAGSPEYATGVDMDGEPWADPPSMGADQAAEAITFVWPQALTVLENEPQATVSVYVVRRPDTQDLTVSVDYATADGAAQAGADYSAVSGTLQFGPGETNKLIAVPLLDDGQYEPGEQFRVVLSHPSPGVLLDEPSAAVVMVLDDEPSVAFASSDFSATENQSVVTVTVTRGNAVDFACAVDLAVTAGTAMPGVDLEVAPATLQFAPGERSKSIVVRILNDRFNEPDKTLLLSLGNPTGGVFLGALAVTTVHTAPVYYVNVANSNPVWPYSSWETAATNIQDAVGASVAAGRIVLVTDGVYQTGTVGPILTPYLQWTAAQVALTNQVTLKSVNGPEATIIDGAGVFSCVLLETNAVLSGFTLRNGIVGAIGYRSGLARDNENVVTNCILTGNGNTDSAVAAGGSLFCSLYNCTLTANFCKARPGAGGAHGCVLYNCILTDNVGPFPPYDWFDPRTAGGALYSTLYNCTLTGNRSHYRGGGASYSTLYNCALTGNTSHASGGGASSSTLYNCTLTGNRSYFGGGATGGTLYNCTLTGNTSDVHGGASVATLYNCTLTGNQSHYGGVVGGYNFSSGRWSTVYVPVSLLNCIVFGNEGGDYIYDVRDTVEYTCTTPLPPGPGNIDADPRFVNAAAGDFRLRPDSPCIDMGTNLVDLTTTDIAGIPRPLDGNLDGVAAFDMGAHEFDPQRIRVQITRVDPTPDGWLLRWDEAATGLRLQRATDLTNPDWVDMSGSEFTNCMALPAGSGPQFFRLVKP